MRLGLRQAFVDHAQQRRRPEGLAQAARRAEPERHSEEVGTGPIEVGKGISGNRDQRHRRRVIVKYPDRFEATHIGHEDIDDHQVERRIVESEEAAGATIGDGHLETIALQPCANGETNMWVVIHYQNASHTGLSPTLLRVQITQVLIALSFDRRESGWNFYFRPNVAVCPLRCIGTRVQL